MVHFPLSKNNYRLLLITHNIVNIIILKLNIRKVRVRSEFSLNLRRKSYQKLQVPVTVMLMILTNIRIITVCWFVFKNNKDSACGDEEMM